MRTRDLTDMLLLGGIWGGAFVLLRIASPEFGAVPLAAVRIFVAVLTLLFFLRERSLLRAQPLRLLLLGLMASAIPFTLYAYAMLSITSGLAALLNATTPMFGALIAWLWLGERLSVLRVAGIVVAFVGVLWLVNDALGTLGIGALGGILAALAGAACYGWAASYTRRAFPTADPVALATGTVLGALAAILPFAVATWPSTPISPRAWIAAVTLGVICTAVAYMIYFRLLRNVGAGRAVTVTFLFPPFGVLWGALVLSEPITVSLLAGCVVVLAGTALAVGLLDRVPY
jgi:drug/metabolite transporter (DMT)-like permease